MTDTVQVPREATEFLESITDEQWEIIKHLRPDLVRRLLAAFDKALAAAPQATDPRERHILITPDRSHVEIRDMDHAMTLLAEQNIAIDTLTEKLAAASQATPHPAPDATDWKAQCEAAEAKWSHYAKLLDEQHGTPCEQIRHREALTAAQAENEKLRAAIEAAIPDLEQIAHFKKSLGALRLADDLRAALSPPPLSPETP